jgi:5-methylcytosine-specific restriction protein B
MNETTPHAAHADEVREFCQIHYIQPARAKVQTEVSIRAGDVHRSLGFINSMPLAFSAIGASVFEERNNIRRVSIEGLMNGANTIVTFELL